VVNFYAYAINLNIGSTAGVLAANGWKHVLASWNLATATAPVRDGGLTLDGAGPPPIQRRPPNRAGMHGQNVCGVGISRPTTEDD
jgi:hypothetical protein